MEEQRCETCRHWWQADYIPSRLGGDLGDYGRCRRYPPSIPDHLAPEIVEGGHASTPLVRKSFRCGEYVPANPETVTEGAAILARLVLLGDLTAARALVDKLREDGV